MNARRSTNRGADHLKMRQLAQLTELRAGREGRCTLSAKASTYIDSIRTSTRAPTFLDQVGVPLYDREPGFEIMERRRCVQ